MADYPQVDEQLGPPVTVVQILPVPVEDVWSMISKPGNLLDFHPFCERNPVEKWPGVGSRDVIHYYSGLVISREFDNWLEGIGYDLTASDQEALFFKVSWRISEEADDRSQLAITIRQVVAEQSERRIQQINRLLKRYLVQVGRGLEYYLRTGERVTRNQFGSNRLFSPPVE